MKRNSVSIVLYSYVLVILLCLSTASWLCADDSRKKEASRAVITEANAKAAIAFAAEHHAELANLLSQLKGMDTKRYDLAIAELYRTNERLLKLKERLPDRYETELAIWKIDSRVRLLAARSVKGMEESVRDEIRDLLRERNQIRLSQLNAEREKLSQRIAKYDESIAALKNSSDELAEAELNRLVKSVKGRSVSKKLKAKEANVSTKDEK